MVGMFGAQRSAAELVHHSNEVLNSQFPHLARAASRSHGFWMIPIGFCYWRRVRSSVRPSASETARFRHAL